VTTRTVIESFTGKTVVGRDEVREVLARDLRALIVIGDQLDRLGIERALLGAGFRRRLVANRGRQEGQVESERLVGPGPLAHGAGDAGEVDEGVQGLPSLSSWTTRTAVTSERASPASWMSLVECGLRYGPPTRS
jgi:hypothetical protein